MADPGKFAINNQTDWWVTFIVPDGDGWWNCCDAPQRGFTVKVPPHTQSEPFVFVRTDGHGCNGEQGQFAFVPTLPTIDAKPQQFWFDSGGGLEAHGPAPNYVSQVAKGGDGVYVWSVQAPRS